MYPETDIEGTFTSFFSYPDSLVQLICKLTYHQFSYYLHNSNPHSIDCTDIIESFYIRVLLTASESKEFTVMEKNLILVANELLKVLRCLCVSKDNQQALITSPGFHLVISNLLKRGGTKEIECALNLLLTLLTEGQENAKPAMTKGKQKKGKMHTSDRDGRESVKETLLSQNPSIAQLVKHALGNAQEDETLKDLCSAVLWCLQSTPGKL